MEKVLTTNLLMKHLRDVHNINITGSIQKQKLRNIGYFHGYKGYRFIKNKKDRISFKIFNEIVVFNDFDIELKTIFYPHIMFIETALKNYVLEEVLLIANSNSFEEISRKYLTYYKQFQVESKDYRNELQKMLSIKNQFNNTLSREYSKRRAVIQHFYHSDRHVPIWAIFEVITMGEFGSFVHSLDIDIKKTISKSIGINQKFDGDQLITEKIIYCLKDLRNAVAHNDVVFDIRFQTSNIDSRVGKSITDDTAIEEIKFKTILDYFILMIYLNCKIGVSKTEIKKSVNRFEKSVNDFEKKIDKNDFFKIFGTDCKKKLEQLNKFIK